MTYCKKLLSDGHIRDLCLNALADVNKLDEALEEIYRQGFAGTPQQEEAPRLFVERLKAVRAEFLAQLTECINDPAQWQLRQLDIGEDPGTTAPGVSLLAALAKGNKWERTECRAFLDRRVAARTASRAEDQALLELFAGTPMTSIFTGGQMPVLPEEKTEQVAGLLAMCSYVVIKRDPDAGVLPEMSFDTVCIWSNAITEALCRRDGPDPEKVATVSCVMAVQYMRISKWEVLKAGIEDLDVLSYPVMDKVLDCIRQELLSREEEQCPVRWIWIEEIPFNYGRWLALLRQQEAERIAVSWEEEEAEYDMQKQKDDSWE